MVGVGWVAGVVVGPVVVALGPTWLGGVVASGWRRHRHMIWLVWAGVVMLVGWWAVVVFRWLQLMVASVLGLWGSPVVVLPVVVAVGPLV